MAPGVVRVVALAAVAAAGVVAYRPDLRAVVSKYIGETEESLRALFNRTERSDTRLAFDEGDALFERRDDSDD